MKSYVIIISLLWCEIFAIIFLLSGFILGSIGACTYIRDRNDERIYRPWKTLCIVRNSTSNRCICQWSNEFCEIYLCFNEEFLVDYEIFNKTIITSSIKTKNQIYQRNLNIGQSSTCYYNGRNNIKSVKWNYNDKTFGFILLCIGYGIVAIDLPILILIFIFLMIVHRRNKQKLIYNQIGNFCDILYRNNQLNSTNIL